MTSREVVVLNPELGYLSSMVADAFLSGGDEKRPDPAIAKLGRSGHLPECSNACVARAVTLTVDPARRAERALLAAQASTQPPRTCSPSRVAC